MSEAGLDWTFRAMGTEWRIHHDGSVTGADAQAVADAVASDERRWSRFRSSSDVSRVNRDAGRWVDVEPATVALVRAAIGWSGRTSGVFQPLVGRSIGSWGYAQALGDGDAAPAPQVVPDASAIELTEGGIRIPTDTALDLGGIGKSWAAARAGRLLLERADATRLILDAGGDLAVLRGSEGITTAAGLIRAEEGEGVATSSSERRRWRLADGTEAHHLIDARTGAPGARGTAVVVGSDVVEAVVRATALVLDPAALDRLERPAAYLDEAGAIRTNAAWQARASA